jgi:hypothetical protein
MCREQFIHIDRIEQYLLMRYIDKTSYVDGLRSNPFEGIQPLALIEQRVRRSEAWAVNNT